MASPVPPAAPPVAAAAAAAPPPAAGAAAPSPAAAGAPDPSAKPSSPATAQAAAGAKDVAMLLQNTAAIDKVWANSANTVQLAVASLPDPTKMPGEMSASVERLSIIGTLLDQKAGPLPAGQKLPDGTDPIAATLGAEKQFHSAVGTVAGQAMEVGKSLDPNTAPKEVVQAYMASSQRLEQAVDAVWAANKLAPSPAAQQAAGQAGAPADAPAPQQQQQAPAGPAPTQGGGGAASHEITPELAAAREQAAQVPVSVSPLLFAKEAQGATSASSGPSTDTAPSRIM